MYRLEHFGHVLAIAFSVSAIFYYVDFREQAIQRFGSALSALKVATNMAEQAAKDAILNHIRADRPGEMFRLSARTKEETEALAIRKSKQDAEMARWAFLGLVGSMISYSHVATHSFAALSTSASLGFLIYAGFDPEAHFSLTGIISVLALSFASIIWNLGFYGYMLPKLTKAISRPSGQDTQPAA